MKLSRIHLGVAMVVCVALVALPRFFRAESSQGPKVRLDRSTVERIRLGMTEQEVEEILGAPAGNYPDKDNMVMISTLPCMSPCGGKEWKTRHTYLCVCFDEKDRVRLVYLTGKDDLYLKPIQ